MFAYTSYGLNLRSEFPLPELTELRSEASAQVTIRRGTVENFRAKIVRENRRFSVVRNAAYLQWDDVATFSVKNGEVITVEPHPEAEEQLIRLPLLGPVLGMALRQRGFLVLHASAVEVAGGIVGFLGDKGWGKSTTAAAFHKAGYPIVSDDILAVSFDSDGRPVSAPGIPQLKLWPEAVVSLGDDPEVLPPIHEGVPKRARRLNGGFTTRSRLPVDALYVLGLGPEVQTFPLPARDAFMSLIRHTYSRTLIGGATYRRKQFEDCSQLVQSLPIRQLLRRRGIARLPSAVTAVERDSQQSA